MKKIGIVLLIVVFSLMVGTVYAAEDPVTGSSNTNAKIIEPLNMIESANLLVDFDDIQTP